MKKTVIVFAALASLSWATAVFAKLKVEVTDKNGKTATYVVYSAKDIPEDRAEFLKGLQSNDIISVRWTGFSGGHVSPLFSAMQLNLRLETRITWNNWQVSPVGQDVKRVMSATSSVRNVELGQIVISPRDVANAVNQESGVMGNYSVPLAQAGFKIAVNLFDSRGAFRKERGFDAVYFDIQELLASPNFTKNFDLKFGDASAQIRVQLIRQ